MSTKRARSTVSVSSRGKKRRIIPYNMSNYGGVKPRVPRAMSSNTCIIPLSINHNLAFTADPQYGYGWTAAALWVNGSSMSAIPGATELAAVFDLMRIVKVECTVLSGCDTLSWGANTIGTGTRNIPYVYEAFDPVSGTNPTGISQMQQLSTCRTHMANKIIKRTIYPTLSDDNVIQTLDRGQFVKSGNNTIPWYGWKLLMDLENTALTYDIGRVEFKVFYECRSSK